MSSFAPAVRMPKGHIVTPRGWMWVLGFALAGCEWAIKEADTVEFRKRMCDDLALTDSNRRVALIKKYENAIHKLIKESKK